MWVKPAEPTRKTNPTKERERIKILLQETKILLSLLIRKYGC